MDLVGRLLALALGRRIADADSERSGLLRVRDVVDVHAAEAGLVLADLVVRHEDRAGELGRRDVDGLYALPGVAALLGGDERRLARRIGVGDVDDVDAVLGAGLPAPGGQKGRVPIGGDADVGDLALLDVLQRELADDLNGVALRRGQVARGTAVLAEVALFEARQRAAIREQQLVVGHGGRCREGRPCGYQGRRKAGPSSSIHRAPRG